LALQTPAVALKVAEVDPAGIVTDAATGSVLLLLDRDTTVPPTGAAWTSVTVQVVLAPAVKLVGAQTNEDKPGAQFVTVTVPDIAEIASPAPFAKAATGLLTVTGTAALLVAGASVTVTVATTPLPIVVPVVPLATHVIEPLTELHVRVLPAAPRTVPAAVTTDLTSLGANPSVHCRPEGAVPLPLNESASETVPPSTVEPDERPREIPATAVVRLRVAVAEVPL
jgi:hypothetical protein